MRTWLFLLLFVLTTPVHAFHGLTDEAGCEAMLAAIEVPAAKVYEGVSEDARTYIMRWKANEGTLTIEIHFWLAPPVQWKDPKTPAPLSGYPPMSVWVDQDGDHKYEDIWLNILNTTDCEGKLHLRWTQDYYKVIGTGGKHS